MKSTKTRVQRGGYLVIHSKDPEKVRNRSSRLYHDWERELGREAFAALGEETSPVSPQMYTALMDQKSPLVANNKNDKKREAVVYNCPEYI